ncbi:hypothetical protein CUMW_016150 [Citrus unshiu]|nr:hypothetical protein CUMW_016150 [Citrus unshiu]
MGEKKVTTMVLKVDLQCSKCYKKVKKGRGGGPCYDLGYGQMRHYDGYCGRPVYESWAGGCDTRGYYRSRCSDYICEENPTAPCTIM